jgi:hypothetical protein
MEQAQLPDPNKESRKELMKKMRMEMVEIVECSARVDQRKT